MKINDLNKIEEGLASSLFGEVPTAAIKGLFTGAGTRATLKQDFFIQDFVGDAIASLKNGIAAGTVDKKNPKMLGTEVDPSTVQSPTAGAVAAQQATRQDIQSLNNYIKQAAAEINKTADKEQKLALTKELVNAMADRQGTPEHANAIKSVEAVIKRSGLTPFDQSQAITNLRTGKIMAEAFHIYYANKLIESVGLTWKDLNLCVLQEGNNYFIAESKYVKLDQLFESILEATTEPAQQTQSISEYLYDWFGQYMSGSNWENKKASIIPLINQVQASGGSKSSIKKLARAAYSVASAGGKTPKGALNAMPAANTQQQPSAQAKSAEEITKDLAELEKTNPDEYKKLVAAIMSKPAPTPTTPKPEA